MNYDNKKMLVFDLDGTLTESKTEIQADMVTELARLIKKFEIAIISGCSYDQMHAQFITNFYDHLYESDKNFVLFNICISKLMMLPTSGSTMYRWDGEEQVFHEAYSNNLSLRDKVNIINAFDNALKTSGLVLPNPAGPIEEDRGSQITLSLLGQSAQLIKKAQFDSDFAKRKKIKELMQPFLPQFNINLGGTTSMDVTKAGVDKSYGVGQILKTTGYKKKDLLFVGDAIFPGGNDYCVKEMGVDCESVNGPTETLDLIKSIGL